MKPIFTIHAGEYLLGSHIEEKYKNLNVWLPSKDTGIDLLVTNKGNKKSVSLQVKFSKDFKVTHMDKVFQKDIDCSGWWTLNSSKIRKSKADLWVFVLCSFNHKTIHYIFITPDELLKRLAIIQGKVTTMQVYLTVTKKGKCWETRGLKRKDLISIKDNIYDNSHRDFTIYLNNWRLIEQMLM